MFRAVVVWTVVLTGVILPRVEAAPMALSAPIAVTQLNAFDHQSVVSQARDKRSQAAQDAQIQAWTQDLQNGMAKYEAQQKVLAAAKAVAAQYAALSNHPPPPPYIAKIINDAFSPLGPRAVQWAINIAYCESRYHPNSVNTDSGATGLFQFMAGTWSGTPWASKSRFDPVANAQAAAWLYKTYGPGRWSCVG
ncbi:MAG: transglycosylase SLT domain-containing protein [Candidatus Dormiibacterota bacterium]